MKRHTKIRDCFGEWTYLYEESYKTINFGEKQKNLYDKSYNKCGGCRMRGCPMRSCLSVERGCPICVRVLSFVS